MSTDTPSRVRRPWLRRAVAMLAVVVVLAAIAHARHQTIGQLVSGTVSAVGGLFSSDGPVSRLTQPRTYPDITITPTEGQLPARIMVAGTGYQQHEKVEVTAHVTVLATVTADDAGAFAAEVSIRADEFCPHAQCTITASGKRSAKWNTAPYDVIG
jgi:hypothetical protein